MNKNNYSRYRRSFTPEEWSDISETFLNTAHLEHSQPFDWLREKSDFCEIWNTSPSYFEVLFKAWKRQEMIENKGAK